MRNPEALSANVRAYLEAENAYTKEVMADTEALQDTLFKEMKGRIKEDDSTVPAPDGAYAYFMSYVTGGQHPRLCREPRAGGERRFARRRRARRGQALFFARGRDLEPRSQPFGLCLRRQGLRVLQDQNPPS